MSTPVPLLRQPVPGQRSSSNGARPPRLGLSIPSSPNVRPAGAPNAADAPPARPTPPPLRLNPVPSSSSGPSVPQTRRPRLNLAPVDSSASISSEVTDTSRNGSLADGGSVSSPAASSVSGHMLAMDPPSAVASSPSGGGGSPGAAPVGGPESQLSMEDLLQHLEDIKAQLGGREPDVADLDDNGWRAVFKSGRIVELGYLGEGAGGAVTRCILKGGNTVFALKVIPTNPDPVVTRQIVREINFNKQCASDHICRYYGAFLDDATGTISIAMEFCEGGSLDSVYKEVMRLDGRAAEKVLQKIAEGVLKGLEYLGQHRIIHRDIKPSNILLCRDGKVKLCDFGVSGEGGTRGDANTFIGTSYYMAPERITGQTYNINCDVWSIGVTLLEVAQHHHPFAEDGSGSQRAMPIELLSIIVTQPIPKLKDEPELKIFWSDNMKDFIDCCLEKNPDVRKKPMEMLEHPWMLELQTKKVSVRQFLKKVWDWSD